MLLNLDRFDMKSCIFLICRNSVVLP